MKHTQAVPCPCGAGRPQIEAGDFGATFIECRRCGRTVAASSFKEAGRMWNAALCNMTDEKR